MTGSETPGEYGGKVLAYVVCACIGALVGTATVAGCVAIWNALV